MQQSKRNKRLDYKKKNALMKISKRQMSKMIKPLKELTI